jgi:protein TonB
MQTPIHAISAPHSRWTTERIAGVGFVGFLHVLAIYALVTGLAQKIIKVIPPDFVVTMDPVQQQKPEPVAPLKPTDLPTLPMDQTVPMPVIDIARDTPQSIDVLPTPDRVASIAPDTAAASIASTHTTPPYPGLARKLGEQGTVKLRLTISPQGVVTAADVVQTSGFPDLDQTAVNWVLANWKYKPAVRGGVAVASTALAAVVFSLKTAR